MRTILTENPRKIKKNKELLEKSLKVEIEIKGKKAEISGKELNEYVAERVLEAINLGFKIPDALLLTDEEFMFETINIKDLSKKNPRRIRGRIIGTKRKTMDTLEELTNCKLVLKDNTVGIIGNAEDIESAMQALNSLIKGSKQSNVYKYLEKQRKNKKLNLLNKR